MYTRVECPYVAFPVYAKALVNGPVPKILVVVDYYTARERESLSRIVARVWALVC